MFPLPIIKPSVAAVSEYDMFITEMNGKIAAGTVTRINPSNVDSDITSQFPGKTKFYFEYKLAQSGNIMYGSPFTTFFRAGPGRLAQHGLQPSVYAWYVQNSGACYFEIADAGSNVLNSINRNGYESFSSGGSSHQCSVFVYYDNVTGFMMQYNPRTNSIPVRYYP